MGGQELDSGALVHFSAASAHSMTICPRAQKSARNGFIHKGEKEKEVLNQLGFDFGECRHPFSALNEEQKAIIAKEIIPYVKPMK